ncbi:hypothetical protein DFH09DRAFT_1085900 [Mycena vulgaris]|nr:hypothetical protein DFH09DRAFT_1085900 [Mycena vulgaris]
MAKLSQFNGGCFPDVPATDAPISDKRQPRQRRSPSVELSSQRRCLRSFSSLKSQTSLLSQRNPAEPRQTPVVHEDNSNEEEDEEEEDGTQELQDSNEDEDTPARKRSKKNSKPQPGVFYPAPHFSRLISAFKAVPIEITVNIAIFSPTEMAKPAKKRTASAAGFMKITDDLTFRVFERKLTSKIIKLASLGYTPDDDDMRINFSVPRHVTQPLAIDDADSYKYMLSNAKKCKDPTIGGIPEPEDDGKSKKKRAKSKIPTENDILPGNKATNDQIAILRTRWTCPTATCKSDFCWISGEEKTHIALGNPHFRMWAAAIILLQRRAAANQPAVAAAPTINITFPDRFADLLQPHPIAPPPPPAMNNPGAAPTDVQNEVMLMPPNTQPPGRMTVAEFCDIYDLDNSVRDKLVANGYKNAAVFYLIKLSELVAMEFLPGEVAELQDAVRQWGIPK